MGNRLEGIEKSGKKEPDARGQTDDVRSSTTTLPHRRDGSGKGRVEDTGIIGRGSQGKKKHAKGNLGERLRIAHL